MDNSSYPISVHLVTYNSSIWLPYILEALVRQTRQDFFLLVIDNGSVDNSLALVEQALVKFPQLRMRCRVVHNKQNLGFARAHNQALAWTDSTYVMLLNPDILLDDRYLESAVGRLELEPLAAAATGKLLKWNFQSASWHWEALPNLQKMSQFDSTGLVIKRSRKVTDRGQGEFDKGQYNQAGEVFGVSGAAPVYRREALQVVSIKGEVFDEDFVSYKEDVDLAWRLRLGGFTAWYEPEAVAYHDRRIKVGGGWREQLKQRRLWPAELKIYSWVNHLAVLLKNDSGFNILRDLPWILCHELAKIMALAVLNPMTLFRAKLRFLRLMPRFLAKRRSLKSTRKLKPQELRKWWTSTRTLEH